MNQIKFLSILVALFFFTKSLFIFANDNNVFSSLLGSLESLANQNLHISHQMPADIADYQKKVRSEIAKVKLSPLIGSERITPELVYEGTSWIESYFMNNRNFDFLRPLIPSEIAIVEKQAKDELDRIFKDKHEHESYFEGLNKKIFDINLEQERLNQGLKRFIDNRSKIEQDEEFKGFFRLLSLVKNRDNLYGLENILYPERIISTDLNTSLNNLEKYTFPDSVVFRNNLQSYYKLISSMKPDNDSFDAVHAAFGLLLSMVLEFNKPKFQKFIEDAIDGADDPRLTGDEFNKKLNGLDRGRQEQVKRKMEKFASSYGASIYLFSRDPFLDIYRSWQHLYEELQKGAVDEHFQVSLKDKEVLTNKLMDYIFRYASSDYSLSNELYYSHIFAALLGEVSKVESEDFNKLIENPAIKAHYENIIKEIEKFRKNCLLKFDKAIAMIEKNPYNEQLKKTLTELSSQNLKSAEELLIKFISSQVSLKSLLEKQSKECIDEINSNELFKTVHHEFPSGDIMEKDLDQYMLEHANSVKNNGKVLLDSEIMASLFIQKVDILKKQTSGSQDQPGENLYDILRRTVLKRRQAIAGKTGDIGVDGDEGDSEEEDDEWEE